MEIKKNRVQKTNSFNSIRGKDFPVASFQLVVNCKAAGAPLPRVCDYSLDAHWVTGRQENQGQYSVCGVKYLTKITALS